MSGLTVDMKSTLLPKSPNFVRLQQIVSANATRQYSFEKLPAASQFEIKISKELDVVTGDTLIVWTHPAPFAQSKTLQFGPFQLIKRSNTTAIVRFPTVQGYSDGPLNGFYLVVSSLLTNSSTVSQMQLSAVLSTSSLPPNSVIAYHSNVWPSDPIILGSGSNKPDSMIASTSLFLPYSDPPLEINKTYVITAVVQSIADNWVEEAAAGLLVLTKPDTIAPTVGYITQPNTTSSVVAGVLSALFIFLIIAILLFFLYYRGWWKYGRKVSSTYVLCVTLLQLSHGKACDYLSIYLEVKWEEAAKKRWSLRYIYIYIYRKLHLFSQPPPISPLPPNTLSLSGPSDDRTNSNASSGTSAAPSSSPTSTSIQVSPNPLSAKALCHSRCSFKLATFNMCTVMHVGQRACLVRTLEILAV
ncbi:unnamed protein product [Echinostoma caproni]|uniref:Protein kinase domain-containing protein n=1 Tax=Echinostoma caproni TaxID=27848 RepID=A0A183B415_9TREM|nr:unnamed protein product [Echinostoma caproni]